MRTSIQISLQNVIRGIRQDRVVVAGQDAVLSVRAERSFLAGFAYWAQAGFEALLAAAAKASKPLHALEQATLSWTAAMCPVPATAPCSAVRLRDRHHRLSRVTHRS